MEIDERSNGGLIQLHVGDVIRLRLGENATTGFRWKLVSDGRPACVLTDDKVEAEGAPGAAGIRTWLFEAARPASAQIELIHVRVWERTPSAFQTFTVGVRVSKPNRTTRRDA